MIFWMRCEFLICPCLEDVVEEWDAEEYGSEPEEGSPEWLDAETFDNGECTCVYQNVQLIFPAEGFFVEPLPEPSGDDPDEERRRRLSLADLDGTSCAEFEEVSEEVLLENGGFKPDNL